MGARPPCASVASPRLNSLTRAALLDTRPGNRAIIWLTCPLIFAIIENRARSSSPDYFMARSLRKGPYVAPKLLKKMSGKKPQEAGLIKTWYRSSQIAPEMVGFRFGVHNGKDFIEVLVSEEMVGHRLGEFSPTRKFLRHGGKIQKELDQKKKEAEISAAKAAKSETKK